MTERAEIPAAVRAVLDARECVDATCGDSFHMHAHVERPDGDTHAPDIVSLAYQRGVSWAVSMMRSVQ